MSSWFVPLTVKSGRFVSSGQLAGPFGMERPGLERAMRRLGNGPRTLDETVMRDQQGIADRFYTSGLLPRAISVKDALWSKQGDRR
jgi:hypothetical protein